MKKKAGLLPGSPVTLSVAWPCGTAVVPNVRGKPENYLNVPKKKNTDYHYCTFEQEDLYISIGLRVHIAFSSTHI